MSSMTASLDPSTRLALANLRAHLVTEGDYSPRALTAIIEYVRAEGCVDSDAPYFYPADVPAAEASYAGGFVEVLYDDPAWGHLTDGDRDHDDVTPDRHFDRSDAATLLTRPISGGCDDIPPPYEPTEQDWLEYRQHMDAVDALDALNDVRIDDNA
jgi:hypothetical protein